MGKESEGGRTQREEGCVHTVTLADTKDETGTCTAPVLCMRVGYQHSRC